MSASPGRSPSLFGPDTHTPFPFRAFMALSVVGKNTNHLGGAPAAQAFRSSGFFKDTLPMAVTFYELPDLCGR
jgi:hypothetical protein